MKPRRKGATVGMKGARRFLVVTGSFFQEGAPGDLLENATASVCQNLGKLLANGHPEAKEAEVRPCSAFNEHCSVGGWGKPGQRFPKCVLPAVAVGSTERSCLLGKFRVL